MTVWQRRMALVINAENSQGEQAAWLAKTLPAHNFGAVCVKIHEGTRTFEGEARNNVSPAYYEQLRQGGLIVGGWGWLEGDDPEGEARLAVSLSRGLGLSFYVANAEAPYEFSPRDSPTPHAGNARYDRSSRFVRAFGEAVKPFTFPRALTSYGRAQRHDIDWSAWAGYHGGVTLPGLSHWRFLPQAYLNESPELSPAACILDALEWWPRPLVHPMIASYAGAAGRLDGTAWIQPLVASRAFGFSVYSAADADESFYRELGAARGIAR